MLIRFIQTQLVGTRCYRAGEVADLPEDAARRLLTAGQAVPVPALETATRPQAPETTSLPAGTPRRGQAKGSK